MSVKEINYILKRVLQMIPVLLLVMVLIFALIRFIPGDPADVMLGARATEESRAMLHAKMGIDKPIYEQFFLFMKNCLRLDFGESILSGEPVSQILARRFQVTASLTGMTALFTMLLALPIGYFSGVNKHNAAGKAINTSALVVMAVPAFWVGILLMYFFGLKLHWFPISGWGDTFGEHCGPSSCRRSRSRWASRRCSSAICRTRWRRFSPSTMWILPAARALHPCACACGTSCAT